MVRETEISTQFGFEINELIPAKGVYQIKTSKGNKCLKKINYGTAKLMYIHKAKEHIIGNGFKNIDRYNLTPEGAPYAIVNDDIYVVTDWIEGRECNFKERDELKRAAEELGSFHLCARGFVPDENIKVRNDIGKFPATLEKRVMTLKKMRDIARKNKRKSEFDLLYLSNVDFYMNLAYDAINKVDVNAYNRVCEKSIMEKVLCHHDFTYHNILFDTREGLHIIDFDYCKSEIQIYDVSTLIIKSLKRLDWKSEYASLILEAYEGVKPVSEDEKNVLRTMLNFPQRFWRLANRYYYKEAGWNEATFNKKMREIIDEKDKYVEFIKSLDDIIK